MHERAMNKLKLLAAISASVAALVAGASATVATRGPGIHLPTALSAHPAGLPISDNATVLAQCSALATGSAYVEAAYQSDAGAIAAWMRRQFPGAPSAWTAYPANMEVTACFIKADWAVPEPPPAAGGGPRPINDRGVILIGSNGVKIQGPIGNSGLFPLTRPTA